jgi:hypothetical protein
LNRFRASKRIQAKKSQPFQIRGAHGGAFGAGFEDVGEALTWEDWVAEGVSGEMVMLISLDENLAFHG